VYLVTMNIIRLGVTATELRKFQTQLPVTRVTSLQPAKWNCCGRLNNQLATLEDGSFLCVRYRHPHHSLVHGTDSGIHLLFMMTDNDDILPVINTESKMCQLYFLQ